MKNKIAKVIAEVGVNHNGSYSRAIKLVNAAKILGADFVKFQIFKTENLVLKNTKKANYQTKNDKSPNQYKMLKKFELSNSDFDRIITYCKKIKLHFLATPFDKESLDFLVKKKISHIKISSADINNFPLLQKIGKLRKKIFLSTGMSTLKEIRQALKILVKAGTKKKNITVLHCTSSYPTPLKDTNLNVIKTFIKKFGDNVGYSDHTTSINVPAYAVLLGAKVIEKHLTLNNHDRGPDHEASLNFFQFRMMVENLKNLNLSLGDSTKKISLSESKNIKYARRSIVAKIKINKGEIFSERNLITKRPADGISPMRWNTVIGKKAKKNFEADEKIIL